MQDIDTLINCDSYILFYKKSRLLKLAPFYLTILFFGVCLLFHLFYYIVDVWFGVKDLNGCTKTQSVVVGTAVKGPKFTNVKNIIIANCGSCHLNGGNTAGYNFDNDCSIVNYWSQIKGSCVQPYTLRQMPPSGALSTTLQAQIIAWVNAGHKYTD